LVIYKESLHDARSTKSKILTFGFRLQQENGTPQASLLPTSLDEQLK